MSKGVNNVLAPNVVFKVTAQSYGMILSQSYGMILSQSYGMILSQSYGMILVQPFSKRLQKVVKSLR
jgi:hypothetical protein